MAKPSEDHAGSGLDKADPKSLLEKLGDTVKTVLAKGKPQDRPPSKEVAIETIPVAGG
jgi:hypothetical protein